MPQEYIGRDHTLREFEKILKRKKASLLVCKGRRRIGKSTFIREAGKMADHYIKIEGIPPREDTGKAVQLAHFAEQVAAQSALPEVPLESWPKALQYLAGALPRKGSTVLLLDEISWMAEGDPDFSGYLKVAWDNLFSQHPRLVLCLCGSVSSWIERNLLNNTGYVGRISHTFHLDPLTLPACNQFWGNKKDRTSSAEKLRVLMVTGGVPRYLEEVDPSETAEQNIHRLAFTPGALLFQEFEQIFDDIFDRRAATYRRIVTALVAGPRTLTQISTTLKQKRGGTLKEALEDLAGAGFLQIDHAFDPVTGTAHRTPRYRLSDNYTRFYLKYIKPARKRIAGGIYEEKPLSSLTAWDTIVGLQFENLVLNNIPALVKAAGLKNTTILDAGPYFQNRTLRRDACQVDLLLRTKSAVYLFECKFREKIPHKTIAEMQEKVRRLKLPRTLSVRTGLIYEGTLENGIEEDDYFDYFIPFGKLLNLAYATG